MSIHETNIGLVSVIVPTYNRRDIVSRAIHSALSQTYRDVEVVVVDDGSTDGTQDVVRGMNNDRIRYFLKPNGGPASARNFGLARSRGPYIAFLDSDDYWPAEYIQVMLGQLAPQPQFGGAYSLITLVRPDGQQIPSYKRAEGRSGWIAQDLFKRGFIWPSASLFRAEAWKGFFFDERLSRVSEDSDAFLRLSLQTQLLFVADVEAFHTISDDSISAADGVACARVLSLERFYFSLGGDKVIDACVARRRLSHAYRTIAEDRRSRGAKAAAMILYRRAIQCWPYDLRLYAAWLQTRMLSGRDDPEPSWRMPSSLDAPIGPSRFA